ncbi:MAG: hypothetical protein LBK94_12080 [Prevotellaceae bacterium]|jgi:hypothetical protein|nr:hypothetical protein [Prevotellaceae bacterium]
MDDALPTKVKIEKISLWISIFAIIIGIIAICTSLNGFSLSETSYLGWTISVLSMLVMILIGWQVYSIIFLENHINKLITNRLTVERERTNKELKRIEKDLNKSQDYIDLNMFFANLNMGIPTTAIINIISILINNEEDEERFNHFLKIAIQILLDKGDINLTKAQKEFCLKEFDIIKIKSYDMQTLRKIIEKIIIID